MTKIYYKLGGDSSLKQNFVLSLQKILEGYTMMIMDEKFKPLNIPQKETSSRTYPGKYLLKDT